MIPTTYYNNLAASFVRFALIISCKRIQTTYCQDIILQVGVQQRSCIVFIIIVVDCLVPKLFDQQQ